MTSLPPRPEPVSSSSADTPSDPIEYGPDLTIWSNVVIKDPNEMLAGDDSLAVEAVAQAVDSLREQQRFHAGLIAAIVAGIAGALVWAAVSSRQDSRYALLAVGLGVVVGRAMRWQGKGIELRFRIAAACVAVVALAAGNVLVIVAYIARFFGLGYVEVMSRLSPAIIWEVLVTTTTLFDLLCYAVAIYYAAKLAPRQLTRGDMHAAALPSARTM